MRWPSIPLLVVLLVACEGGPCGDRWCPYGQTCVSANGLPGSRLYCARPTDPYGSGCSGSYAPAVEPDDELRITEYYCWYGDQPVGAPCVASEECACEALGCDITTGFVERCDPNTWTCQPYRCSAACDPFCGLRPFCTPRCDEPSGIACRAGYACLFGLCQPRRLCGPDRYPCSEGSTCIDGLCLFPEDSTVGALDCNADGLLDCPPGTACGAYDCIWP